MWGTQDCQDGGGERKQIPDAACEDVDLLNKLQQLKVTRRGETRRGKAEMEKTVSKTINKEQKRKKQD